MFGGSSRSARRPFNLSGRQERGARSERSHAMTEKPISDLLPSDQDHVPADQGHVPPDQGRASSLYDEQLQRQQQEKMLLSRVEQRLDLLAPAKDDD